MRITRRLPPVLALLLLLTACASAPEETDPEAAVDATGNDATTAVSEAAADPNTGGGAAAGDQDACLNTVEEVSTALGVDVTEAENTPDAAGAYCSYYIDQAANQTALSTTLLTGADAETMFNSYASSSESVSGMGDEAIWSEGSRTLFIRKGDRLLSMVIMQSSVPAAEDEAAARAMLEELGPAAGDRL